MRYPFTYQAARGMGGGGGVIRGSVQRTIRVGGASTDTFSNASTSAISKAHSRNAKQVNKLPNTALTLSSSSSSDGGSYNNGTQPFYSLINFPVSAAPPWDSASSANCGSEESSDWERIEEIEEGVVRLSNEDLVFETSPTTVEVEQAVSALQQALACSTDEDGTKADADMVDWLEPLPYLNNSRKLQRYGSSNRVMDAFHLLQTDPSIQRMVVSISSDKAVWDAVLNNEVVKDIRGSILEAENSRDEDIEESKDDDSSPVMDILRWLTVHAKANIAQLIEKVAMSWNLIFQVPKKDEKKGDGTDAFEEKLKMSVMLSVVVWLVVVVTRLRGNLST